MKKVKKTKAEFIKPLSINGLHGRVLKIQSKNIKSKNKILLIYGHHSSLERMYGVAENLSKYGSVTMPDLPGFGGMDSFYKIDQEPTLDNLADYLATFIKLEFKKQKIIIAGMSIGFVIVTRMLQKYPELSKQVNMLISIVGFTHKKDFKFKKKTYYVFQIGSRFFSKRWPAAFVKYAVLRAPVIRATYKIVADKHVKMKDASEEERKRRVDFEVGLWQSNDLRTYMATSVMMLSLDITNIKVGLPLVHIATNRDQYFNNTKVRSHLKKIYKPVEIYKIKLKNHAPSVIGDSKHVEAIIPKEVRKKLSKMARS
jgi:pimeloyl-ACP methyl ester carboxylesterase